SVYSTGNSAHNRPADWHFVLHLPGHFLHRGHLFEENRSSAPVDRFRCVSFVVSSANRWSDRSLYRDRRGTLPGSWVVGVRRQRAVTILSRLGQEAAPC